MKGDRNVTTQHKPAGTPETPNQGTVNFDKQVTHQQDCDTSPDARNSISRKAIYNNTTEDLDRWLEDGTPNDGVIESGSEDETSGKYRPMAQLLER